MRSASTQQIGLEFFPAATHPDRAHDGGGRTSAEGAVKDAPSPARSG
jgi:hypothetical protein